MSVLLQIIGIIVGLILMCSIAATPINKYITIIKEKITVIPKPTIILPIEPNMTPTPLPAQIDKYPVIHNFLNNLPDCDWCIACGSYARYTRLEAEKQGISINEITLTIPDNAGLNKIEYGDGHRINFFYDDNNNRVYIDNMYNWGLILESNELIDHLNNNFNMTTKRIGFKNIKLCQKITLTL